MAHATPRWAVCVTLTGLAILAAHSLLVLSRAAMVMVYAQPLGVCVMLVIVVVPVAPVNRTGPQQCAAILISHTMRPAIPVPA